PWSQPAWGIGPDARPRRRLLRDSLYRGGLSRDGAAGFDPETRRARVCLSRERNQSASPAPPRRAGQAEHFRLSQGTGANSLGKLRNGEEPRWSREGIVGDSGAPSRVLEGCSYPG